MGRSVDRKIGIKPKRIMVPTFEIASNPEIKLSEIKARRFYIILCPDGCLAVWDDEWLNDKKEIQS